MAAETESRFTSVERMSAYIDSVPVEAPAEIKETKPPDDWPQKGSIIFNQLKVNYFHIQSSNKDNEKKMDNACKTRLFICPLACLHCLLACLLKKFNYFFDVSLYIIIFFQLNLFLHLYYKYQQMRYRPGLPLVLNNVTGHIHNNEKIGIVGRTGSGKSSLGISLWRLVEAAAGTIKIDEIDISTVGTYSQLSLLLTPSGPIKSEPIKSHLPKF